MPKDLPTSKRALCAGCPLNFSYAELRGTYSHSEADGTTVSEEYQIPLGQYLGLRTHGYRVYCPGLGEIHDYFTATVRRHDHSTSLTINSIWVIPRTR